jgi:hypothetical protein
MGRAGVRSSGCRGVHTTSYVQVSSVPSTSQRPPVMFPVASWLNVVNCDAPWSDVVNRLPAS